MRSIRLRVDDRNHIISKVEKVITDSEPVIEQPPSESNLIQSVLQNICKDYDQEWQKKLEGTELYLVLQKSGYVCGFNDREGNYIYSFHTVSCYQPSQEYIVDKYHEWKDSEEGITTMVQNKKDREEYRAVMDARREKYAELRSVLKTATSTKQLLDSDPELINHFPQALINEMNSPKPTKGKAVITETFTL